MAKPGRNDPCSCGSGKKYKKCCLAKDEAEMQLQAEHEQRARARPWDVHNIADRMATKWADDTDDAIADLSHTVVALVKAGKNDDAEAAARTLILRYPDRPDGWDCLGIVHEARGENRQAVDCYRKMREIMRAHPDDYYQDYEAEFAKLIAKLDPSTPT